MDFLLAGGVPMIGVLVCGLIAVFAAVRFAMAPDRRKIGAIVSLSVATTFSSILGVVADLREVASHGPDFAKAPDTLVPILLVGFAESMSPVMFGFATLTAVWLVMAVGFRRLVPRLPA